METIKRTLAPLCAVAALVAAVFFFFNRKQEQDVTLRVTAGDLLGPRAALARALGEEATPLGVHLKLIASKNSEAAIEMVEKGEADVALVQGGVEGGPGIRQVVALFPEPIHALVKTELPIRSIPELRGHSANLGSATSGTRMLSEKAIRFAGLEPGRDLTVTGHSYEEMRAMERAQLPDAIFLVVTPPAAIAEFFIQERQYRLLPLPYGRGLGYHDSTIVSATIPAMVYSVSPPVPEEDLPSLGNNLLVVAREEVDSEAIERLLEATFDQDLAARANLRDLTREGLQAFPRFPLHAGTLAYIRRNDPVLTSETIDNVESLRSFLVSLAVAVFFIWQWWERRKAIGFEKYIDEVTSIEDEVLDLDEQRRLDVAKLQQLRERVSRLKSKALREFAQGRLKGEELMSSFLAHVTDVRNHLNALLLHERDRREELAIARGNPAASTENSPKVSANE